LLCKNGNEETIFARGINVACIGNMIPRTKNRYNPLVNLKGHRAKTKEIREAQAMRTKVERHDKYKEFRILRPISA
jgi:hypothetical protein